MSEPTQQERAKALRKLYLKGLQTASQAQIDAHQLKIDVIKYCEDFNVKLSDNFDIEAELTRIEVKK